MMMMMMMIRMIMMMMMMMKMMMKMMMIIIINNNNNMAYKGDNLFCTFLPYLLKDHRFDRDWLFYRGFSFLYMYLFNHHSVSAFIIGWLCNNSTCAP